jgi:NAD(P)-dependent dehydrogenase (short-subunit alcohol dehydrogenase family)
MAKNTRPTAWVTGAARGIGRGIAEHLLAAGWNVAVADVLMKEGRAAVKAMNKAHGKDGARAVFIPCDVSKEKEVATAAKAIVAEFGRLDGLVNNAGLAHPYNGPVNLTGPWLCAKHTVAHLRRAPGGGAIVNIASTRALQAEANTEAYSATKAGLLGLTRALAVSLGPKVRVNAICPGWIDTRPADVSRAAAKKEKHAQHPVGRVGRPEDIATMVEFLLDGTRSGFVTGQRFVSDGGMTVKLIYEE